MLAVFHATATMLWVAVNTLYDPIWHVSSRGGEECCELLFTVYLITSPRLHGGWVTEWLACWTQAQKGLQIAAATLSANS